LTFRRFDTCVLSVLFALPLLSVSGRAQTPPAPAAPTAVRVPTAPPTPAPVRATPAQPAGPDYPDPRTLTVGIFYWMTLPVAQPNLYGGSQVFDYETLRNLGKVRSGSPGIEVSLPITRTGELHFEYFLAKGDGNQNAPAALDLFGTSFNQGDVLATQYQIQDSKIYLDDLLFPHKFPVAKFRLKSLWEFQYVHMKSTIDAPYVDSTGVQETAEGTKQIFLPTFGLAAEYAIAKHVLLRADASGFGLPHKSDLWDAEATVSYRRGMWEIVAGGKAFHLKTSPNSDEYLSDTLAGAFVGLRWHWSL